MEIFFIRRRKAAVYGLVVLLIAVSIAFTQDGPKVFQAFIGQNRQIPIYSVDIPEKRLPLVLMLLGVMNLPRRSRYFGGPWYKDYLLGGLLDR